MATLGLIPARGGSKGLPRKNIRLFAGRPLIHWSCRAAIRSDELDAVICSTDSEEIANVARNAGVSVPFMRPAELAADTSLIVDVAKHVLLRLASAGRHFDYVCLIQPTSPLISAEDIDRAVRLARQRDADTVISGFACGQKHPATMFRTDEQGAVQWLLPVKERMARRQDLPPVFIRSGLVYVFRSEMVIQTGTLYGDKVFAVEVPEERAISIDSELDFQIAEFLFGIQQHSEET